MCSDLMSAAHVRMHLELQGEATLAAHLLLADSVIIREYNAIAFASLFHT
jgi:hypothetical protein